MASDKQFRCGLPIQRFAIGDRVVKNADAWVANAFDSWKRGIGVGVVVEPPFFLERETVDVRWPSGCCFEAAAGLLPAPPVQEIEAAMHVEANRYLTLMPALLAEFKAIAEVPRMKVHGELHLQYHEACVWVLLADKADARATLIAMQPVLARHQALWPDITVTLSFNAIEDDMRIYIALLEGKDIHDAQHFADLASYLQSVPLSQHDRSFWEIDETAIDKGK